MESISRERIFFLVSTCDVLGKKNKNKCVSGFRSEKLGMVGRHYQFFYQNILCRNCTVHYIFHNCSAYLTIFCS